MSKAEEILGQLREDLSGYNEACDAAYYRDTAIDKLADLAKALERKVEELEEEIRNRPV